MLESDERNITSNQRVIRWGKQKSANFGFAESCIGYAATEQAMLGGSAGFVRRPGDRFGDDAMTIFNEGRHAIRALGAAVAATAVCMKNYFVHGLTRAEGTLLGIMPDRRIAGSPDRRIAGSPDRRIAGSPDRRIAGSPDRRIAGSPDRRIAGSPDRRIAGSPDRRIAGSPDRRIAGSPDRAWCVFMVVPPKALRLPA